MQSGAHKFIGIQRRIADAFRKEFNLADDFRMVLCVPSQSPQIKPPVSPGCHRYPVAFLHRVREGHDNPGVVGHLPGNRFPLCVFRKLFPMAYAGGLPAVQFPVPFRLYFNFADRNTVVIRSILNSLQAGFRNMALSKKSFEVMKLLEAIKAQFAKMDAEVEKTQKKLSEAMSSTDKLQNRTRIITRRMQKIGEMDMNEAKGVIDLDEDEHDAASLPGDSDSDE